MNVVHYSGLAFKVIGIAAAQRVFIRYNSGTWGRIWFRRGLQSL